MWGCWTVSFLLGYFFIRPTQSPPVSQKNLSFTGEFAFEKMKELSFKFPYRIPENENLNRSTDWVAQEFKSLGYEPHEHRFQQRLYQVTYTDLKNIWAEKKGTQHPEDIILICAHVDISEKTKYGSMDDASGIGIIFELAKILQKENTSRTVLFLVSNSEERGAFWGARSFIRDFDRIQQVKAALILDFVAPRKQAGIIPVQDGLFQGFTPIWLRQLSRESILSSGSLLVDEPIHILEYVQRAIASPPSDHGVFIEKGIPALNWVGKTAEFPNEMKTVHHTLEDNPDNMQLDSFLTYGRAVERLMRSLDELSVIPKEGTLNHDLKLTENRYLPGAVVKWIQVLLFLPFFIFSFLYPRNLHLSKKPLYRTPEFQDEFKSIAFWFLVFLSAFGVMKTFPYFNLLPFYEMHPGAGKSDIQASISPVAFFGGVGLSFLFYWIWKRAFAFSTQVHNPSYRLAAVITVFAITCLTSFLDNSFAATLYLLVAAYFWTLAILTYSKRKKKRAYFLIFGGLMPLVTIDTVVGILYQNPYVFYYTIIGTIYSCFSIWTAPLALGFFISLYRLIWIVRKS